jgi:putative hydrolase of the HAD superfamily
VIRAVTFDAAGTLITPREPVGVVYAGVARRFGVDVEATAVDAAFHRVFTAAPPLAFCGAPPDEVPRLERAWWGDVAGAALGLDRAAATLGPCVDALLAHYARADAWLVYPDVPPALDTLLRHGLALGVVSNFDGRLPTLLRDLGIASAFSTIVWSSDAGAAKPAMGIFAAAAAALAVPLAALLHVGDDPDLDVGGAHAAGSAGWLVDRTSPTAELPDLMAVAARLLECPR